VTTADRPTVTLTPLDDQEFTRRLFTPMSLDGILYLAKTTWPISTVFRLYLENLNWISNAQTASGPTPKQSPDYTEFLRGIEALQILQDRGEVVFAAEERIEKLGSPVPAARVTAREVLDAAKEGFEYHADDQGGTWTLIKKKHQPVMKVRPDAADSPEMREFARVFHIKRGLPQYDIEIEKLEPFPATYPPEGVEVLDLETRSLLQVLYFLSKGVEVPADHSGQGLVQETTDRAGERFDWQQLTRGLFHVSSVSGGKPPPSAHVAIKYLDHWFYIDRRDQDSMSTFSLLMELARLELPGKVVPGPALTLPVGGR
jgi:hypothetical protein